MNEIILQTHNLHKHFGDVHAVKGINMPVYAGELFGFLGPNGSGKTTAIGMILGLVHPTDGEIELFGEQVTPHRTGALKRVGSLIGAPAFVPHFTAERNLQLVANLYPNVSPKAIDETLEQVGLMSAKKRKAKTFSSGMKQRLGLAAALLHKPDLLILDEPSSGLDPNGMREFRRLFRRLADEGTTIFLSSHMLNEVQQICDRVAILKDGAIVAQGDVDDLLRSQSGVKLAVPEPEVATLILRQLPDAVVTPNGNYVAVAGIPTHTIVSHLTSNGIIPTEISEKNGDLEELFVSLTN